MSFKVEQVAEPVLLGEGPHWDGNQQALYYVSIRENTIHKYTPSTGEHAKTKLDGNVGFIVPVEGTNDQFVVGLERKFVIIQWNGKNGSPIKIVKELGEIDHDVAITRLNDGKCDPRGRLFAGTMAKDEPAGNYKKEKGSFFRVDGTTAPRKLFSMVNISNGLAWDLKEKAFYYIDSFDRAVTRFDYDVETGEISNKKHIFDLEKNEIKGFPDGMTIDTDGNLWVAIFDGSRVIKIDPRTGKLLLTVPIPAPQVTSVTFGGENLDILFVTTASMKINDDPEPPSGATFMVLGLGVKGHPNVHFKL